MTRPGGIATIEARKPLGVAGESCRIDVRSPNSQGGGRTFEVSQTSKVSKASKAQTRRGDNRLNGENSVNKKLVYIVMLLALMVGLVAVPAAVARADGRVSPVLPGGDETVAAAASIAAAPAGPSAVRSFMSALAVMTR